MHRREVERGGGANVADPKPLSAQRFDALNGIASAQTTRDGRVEAVPPKVGALFADQRAVAKESYRCLIGGVGATLGWKQGSRKRCPRPHLPTLRFGPYGDRRPARQRLDPGVDQPFGVDLARQRVDSSVRLRLVRITPFPLVVGDAFGVDRIQQREA